MDTWVLARVAKSMRIRPLDLEKEAARHGAWKKQQVKKAVRNLVEAGTIAYTSEFGTSFLEKCFTMPSRLSRRIVAAPCGCCAAKKKNDVIIKMSQGASFGSGRHPTTRMAVQAIEDALGVNGFLRHRLRTHALDVGSGSGILALAAVKLGMQKALCIDFDPCALFETRTNAGLNNLLDQIAVSDMLIDEINGEYPLILANLRLPTLLESLLVFEKISPKKGVLIISGIKENEAGVMRRAANKRNFALVAQQIKLDWAAITFIKEH